ncbi:histidinol dehydrogenase [Nanchangia anserum]|uniref:Histidinol dehydrogenase n=1 Tax=Nanchangia anserum TaxID=2692125 RepID=A0A8I0GDG3_9ACTO|nr:histidinol dehydrogenase [Nanchangia anserum]MBD3690226.1 histidinol dehydrogenase [Nanchangia anserum]QOX82329.1 histidinol dehydrogenase [Nanchangia anserum]
MLSVTDLRDLSPSPAELNALLPRARVDLDAAIDVVTPIMEDVRSRGREAIAEWSRRFDGSAPEELRVSPDYLNRCLDELDPAVRTGLEIAIAHNRAGHRAQMPREVATEIVPGGIVRQRWIPVRRVGLYVPGGLAVYPSSVVMNVVAAQVAGVAETALVTPPQRHFDGNIHPTIAAACALLGVDEVYAVGGAQAIAMLAWGIDDGEAPIAPVDVITGPGNIYVAAAKRVARSVCGIDAEAGTTEIAIIADDSAHARFVAADLASQAEHDPAAASVLITDSEELAREVDTELEAIVAATRHSDRCRTALGGPQSGILLVSDIDQAIDVANAYAAEHLEIHTANAEADAARIHNAGAIFVGPYSPVPLGDYVAGSNHVLPTSGTARYAAGLNVMAFIKPVQQIHYTAEALAELTPHLGALAESEDLPAHGEAARARA